jgi:hypothetical protein
MLEFIGARVAARRDMLLSAIHGHRAAAGNEQKQGDDREDHQHENDQERIVGLMDWILNWSNHKLFSPSGPAGPFVGHSESAAAPVISQTRGAQEKSGNLRLTMRRRPLEERRQNRLLWKMIGQGPVDPPKQSRGRNYGAGP